MMSKASGDAKVCAEQNEFGPDYLGYYKHLVSELFSQTEDFFLPVMGVDSKSHVEACSKGENEVICNHDKGKEACSSGGSVLFFNEGIGKGLSEFKKERLKAILDQSAVCINQDVDEVFDHILAILQIESDYREKDLLSCYSSASDEDISDPLSGKKRKASSIVSKNSDGDDGTPNSQSIRKVYQAIQALQGNGEICPEAVENYSVELCSKLGKMEQDLEEYLNVVVSKCRPMTHAEKQQLGRQIQKLPNKALDRVIEIIQLRNISARNISDSIFINLEKQDNVTLWRLRYYAEAVMKANKIQ